MFKKRPKKELTYEEAHNKAFSRYKKSSQILIWAGALNVIGLIVAFAQLNTETFSFNPFLCFASNNLIFRLLTYIPWLKDVDFLWYIFCIIIAIASSAGLVLLGVFAQQGKKSALFTGVGLYLFDTFCVISLNFVGESITNLWLVAGIHVIIMAFLCVAIYEYFNIIKIAEKYGILK